MQKKTRLTRHVGRPLIEVCGIPKDCIYDKTTLRDEFAMAALTGALANSKPTSISMGDYAVDAFAYADVMLKERGVNVC